MTGKTRIPTSFNNAEWRGTLPLDISTDRIGLSFDLENGETTRLAISSRSARQVINSLSDYLTPQSSISSGNPSSDVSCSPGGENV